MKVLRAIKNTENSSHIDHLPRGYFKKRKPPDDAANTCPSSLHRNSFSSIRCRFSHTRPHVNTNFLIVCTVLLVNLMFNGVTASEDALRLKRAIEENIALTIPVPASLPNGGGEFFLIN